MSIRAVSVVLLSSLGLTSTHARRAADMNAFNKVWTVALSRFDESEETGNAVTQLADGTILVGGNDANLQNACSTHAQPLFGGAWLVAVAPGTGINAFQKLYSTCASRTQTAEVVAATAEGGFMLAGGDFANPACGGGCGWFAKFNDNAAIVWQHDLVGAYNAGAVAILPMPDGSYTLVGNEAPTDAEVLQGTFMRISAAGALQPVIAFAETGQSFPGAVSNGSLTLESIQPTADGGYITTGVANAKFSSGFAYVVVVMKLDALGNRQWAKVYYGSDWVSAPPGDGKFRSFPTADGGYVVSGTVQQPEMPFGAQFFLMKLDASGQIVWQRRYGGMNSSNSYYDVSDASAGAIATPDGGYVLAGTSNIFLQATTGWILKTDSSGNILWQKAYSGLTSKDGNEFFDIVQTNDGGFAVTGASWTANLTYGGPGLWLLQTDAAGNIANCACMVETDASSRELDLQSFPGAFVQTTTGLRFAAASAVGKKTSVTPTTVYP